VTSVQPGAAVLGALDEELVLPATAAQAEAAAGV
jgi:hypothetical protein